MVGAKREPSSLVQSMSSSGESVTTSFSLSVRMTSSPDSTPAMPSNFPPDGCVSRWLPKAIGGRVLSRPALRAKMLPTSSTVTTQPSARHWATNQSRTSLSASLSVNLVTPPPGVPPKRDVSMIVLQSRSPFTRSSRIPNTSRLQSLARGRSRYRDCTIRGWPQETSDNATSNERTLPIDHPRCVPRRLTSIM